MDIAELKDYFSRNAASEIESLFLMLNTRCAFVNYRTKAACVAAMSRFNGSSFRGARLVCRLRQDSVREIAAETISESRRLTRTESKPTIDGNSAEGMPTPIIARSTPAPPRMQSADAITPPELAKVKVQEKFFIMKSLTMQDLEASVRTGTWATQPHNVSALNRAFSEAENVCLIFSANRSGAYFGYARMESDILGEPVPIIYGPMSHTPYPGDGPKLIAMPATETAPRGRIIDDSARGIIFWETELSDEHDDSSPQKIMQDGTGGHHLGQLFKVAWVSTSPLPFHRTRGLRNPWNANREVKIARDGTELEPSTGKRLVQMFHHPAQVVGLPPPMPRYGTPYQMSRSYW